MHITVQTCYDLQYIKTSFSGYINAPTKPAFIYLKHGTEYKINHPHEPIMYSGKKIHRTEDSPHQFYFKSGDAEISKNKEYYIFPHTYFYADHARNISERRSATSTVNLLNSNIIDWCTKKNSETPRIISNTEIRAMYIGALDQNCIRDLFRSIGYTIGPPSKLY